ncbi:E3 ubiquitin-protein ligase TRIM33-like isoform X2 [Pomacea canaliculata]|nr:E3 ubiquitin-protein ligase TRIM33-like isoform X2 [Pomacea canaliculata]XP_025114406.1 E3 ubiquitin-protein ligase TRIM33-like isoform X2 [Pomacea canaliculata]XP_025114407.1 E3 ubiquitin-protein ligase TRIM33-like isoform X2 [Pomacea canaliculata]XP_025114408.1 E3 ubiquitin-protein ligase TRIM33-like isoform X2 [Pomacea canaliculata]XP_025114409.1 E3 ubiquitin-protein ligase TRIM33-like isoform X2 [Pomacea canaliculata]
MAEPLERECAVCTNDFTTPKILPCGHLLCRECVISWIDSKCAAGCPLCRCPIVQQSDGSSSDTVDALPTDFVMEALVESARVLSKDHLCCVCEDVRADFICMQCQVMLCTTCKKAHKKLPVSRSHDVESVSTVTPERLAASRPALCADHGDKHAEFFCSEHRLAVCSACKSTKHKVCLETNYLDDEIKSVQNSLTDITKNLVEAEQKLEQAIGQLTSRLQEVDVSEQEDMAQVDKVCNCLYKLVEDVCNKLKDKCRKQHLKIRKSLCDVKTGFSNRLGKVTSHRHIVTRAVAVSPRPALIHMTQALTDRVNSLDLSTDLLGDKWEKPLSSVECCKEVVRRIEDELLMLKQEKTEAKLVSQPPVLVFHDNCGTNIRLTNGNRTAEKTELNMIGDGVVVSRDPMLANVLYEVRVDAGKNRYKKLSLGVTRISPAHLTVKEWSEDLKDSVIIMPGHIFHQRKRVPTPLTKELGRLKVGSRVGVLVTSSNELHLYINGQDLGVAANNVTQPWFAVFDIGSLVSKVTALPTSLRT